MSLFPMTRHSAYIFKLRRPNQHNLLKWTTFVGELLKPLTVLILTSKNPKHFFIQQVEDLLVSYESLR